jgi:DNA-binding transcriptional ArsR family regulator
LEPEQHDDSRTSQLIVLKTLTSAEASLTMFNLMVEHHGKQLDRVFSAIADPTRRAILQEIARKPSIITDLARSFPVSLNAVSKHVMVLERAGLVRREIKGRTHICRLEPRPLRDANLWLEQYREFWNVRLDALAIYVSKKFNASKRGKHGNIR